ncbi:MAG: NAD(P)/FAD-dependent oxidoreductase, partial [Acidobacteria bacterium]|nr:NAD(P)/FAD-dependent oxidoreductase [Acidobacteriota bacterium]
MRADVLIIGAGPAGSAAALALARKGASVAFVDRAAFPRDKICGDALIPDALAALEHLGLRESVCRAAKRLDRIRLYSANGRFTTIRGECACLPRAVLDNLLLEAARAAGAHFLPGHEADAPILQQDVVAGAVFRDPTGARREIQAGTTLLACGASAAVLQRFGVAERMTPSAIACRQYFRADARAASDVDFLCLAFIREIGPGYGWIFPGPDNIFNIGIGCFHDMPLKVPKPNLKRLLAGFLETFPPARDLVRHAEVLTPLKGAPIRTAMCGARFARPGLLVVGEAAGLTYSFSGEGIGKAMESGMLAADIISSPGLLPSSRLPPSSWLPPSGGRNGDAAAVADRYAEELSARFGARFRAYRCAQEWLAWEWVGNLLT